MHILKTSGEALKNSFKLSMKDGPFSWDCISDVLNLRSFVVIQVQSIAREKAKAAIIN